MAGEIGTPNLFVNNMRNYVDVEDATAAAPKIYDDKTGEYRIAELHKFKIYEFKMITGLKGYDKKKLHQAAQKIWDCLNYMSDQVSPEDIIDDPLVLQELEEAFRGDPLNPDPRLTKHQRYKEGTTLNLTGLQLVSIPDDLFTELPLIRRFYCSDNFLPALPPSLKDLTNLRVLIFDTDYFNKSYDVPLYRDHGKKDLIGVESESKPEYAARVQEWLRIRHCVTKSANKR